MARSAGAPLISTRRAAPSVGFRSIFMLVCLLGGSVSTRAQSNLPGSGNLTPAQVQQIREQVAKLQDAAGQNGYVVSVSASPNDYGVGVSLSKDGKTLETHGLLGKKWDERETISFQYVPTSGGVRVANWKRVVEQKPPIGEWKTVTEGTDIPADLLSAAIPKN
jgi:hypothetical protein